MALPRYWSERRPSRILPSVSGTSWSSSQNAVLEDTSYATGSYPTNNALVLQFDWPLPPEAETDWVEVWVKCYSPTAGKTVQCQLRLGANTYPSDRAAQVVGTAAPGTWFGFALQIPGLGTTEATAIVADPSLVLDVIGGGVTTNYLYVNAVYMRVNADHGVAVGRPAASTNVTQPPTGTGGWNNVALTWSEEPSSATTFCQPAAGTGGRALTADTLNCGVPADAEVLGIRLRAKGYSGGAPAGAVYRGYLASETRDVAIQTADAAPAPQSRWHTMADGLKDMWGTTWPPVDVNLNAFNFSVQVVAGTASGTFHLDAVECTVLYRAAPKIVDFEHGMVEPKEAVTLTMSPAGPTGVYYPTAWVQQWADSFADGNLATAPAGQPLDLGWDFVPHANVTTTEDAAADQLWFASNGGAGYADMYLDEHVDFRDRCLQVSAQLQVVAGEDAIIRIRDEDANNSFLDVHFASGGWMAVIGYVDNVYTEWRAYFNSGYSGGRFLIREESGWFDVHFSSDWGATWNLWLGGWRTPFSMDKVRISVHGGRSEAGAAATMKMDDVALLDIAGAWSTAFEDDSAFTGSNPTFSQPVLSRWSNNGAAIPAVVSGKCELAVPAHTPPAPLPNTGFNTSMVAYDTRSSTPPAPSLDGKLQAKVEMPSTPGRFVLRLCLQDDWTLGMVLSQRDGGWWVSTFNGISPAAEANFTQVFQSTLWLRVREVDPDGWEFAYSTDGSAFVVVAREYPWVAPKTKPAGLWQMYAEPHVDGTTSTPAFVVRVDDVAWNGEGQLLYPVYEGGRIVSGLKLAAVDTVKPAGIENRTPVVTDDFNDSVIDPMWNVFGTGPVWSVTEVGGALEFVASGSGTAAAAGQLAKRDIRETVTEIRLDYLESVPSLYTIMYFLAGGGATDYFDIRYTQGYVQAYKTVASAATKVGEHFGLGTTPTRLRVRHSGGTSVFDFQVATMVANPDFEASTAGWNATATAAIARDTAEKHGGTASCKVTVASGSGQGLQMTTWQATKPGQVWSGAFWVKAPVGVVVNLGLAFYTPTPSTFIGWTLFPVTGTGAWQRVTGSAAAPATAGRMTIVAVSNTAGSFWVDDIELTCDDPWRPLASVASDPIPLTDMALRLGGQKSAAGANGKFRLDDFVHARLPGPGLNAKIVAGIHIEPTGIASTAVVSTGAMLSLAGTIRPIPGIANVSQVGTPRIPAYVRMTGIAPPPPPRVGQPTLIPAAPILPPQARVKIEWRIILCDQLGNGLEDISSFALDRQFSYRLNRPEYMTFRVPSDHRLVNELAPDERPNLAIIRRTIKAYRSERRADGTEFFNLRFVGWVWQLQDEGDADNAWTTVSCYGPMQRLQRRMCVGPGGSLTNAAWSATDGGLIVHSILSQLNAGAAYAHTGVDLGTREATEVRTVDLTNMSLAAAIVQLTSAFNGFDIRIRPQDRRDGHLAYLDVMARRGSHRSHAIFGWGIAPHNVVDSTRIFDAEQYANVVTLQGATPEVDGARPIQAEAQNVVQQQDVGVYRSVESYPDVSNQSYLQALANEELGFRARAREIVSLRPQPGRAPEPFTEYDLGDTVPLYVGGRQRGGYQGVVRIYGFDLDVNNEGQEIVSSLVLSPE